MTKVCREAGISRVLFYRWLKRYKEEGQVVPKKPTRVPKPDKKKKKPVDVSPLSPQQRLKAVKRVVENQEPIARVCRDFQISRPTLYKWLKRYQKVKKDKEISILEDKEPEVERYYHQTPEKYVEAVLDVVSQHPELGVNKIVKALPHIGEKPIVGHHGVQNILRRQDLNTYEKRLVYAQSQVTPLVRLARVCEDLATQLMTLPVEFRVRLIRFSFTAFASTLITVLVFGTISYFVHIAAGASLVSRIGLFLASVSLGIGLIFFAYSMKYYFTLALVLSFSRRPLEEGGGYALSLNGSFNGQANHRDSHRESGGVWGWLRGVFNTEETAGLSTKNDKAGLMPAGGLQPSLDHIKLKRKPFVSIHLPFYNEAKVAERILTACTSMEYYEQGKAAYEVIVCDDSTDKTVQIVQNFAQKHNQKNPHGPRVKVLHRPTREGFKGAALGYALEKVHPKTEFIVVFDADFVPYPDTLELFVKYFKANNPLPEAERKGKEQFSEDYTRNKIAAVTGYQWHVLNKSETWVTRAVRTEYAGSYVIERSGREILGLLKQIHGTVYMVRKDALKEVGWGTSITEDFQLTLKLYEAGYKVVYTPYVQAPAECVSTLKRLIRQRMRWAEGHSNCIKRKFWPLMTSPKLSAAEKIEVLYLTPYYLQAFFFMIGTLSWLLSEAVFQVRLPFWTSLWGWSLVLTNFLSMPLVNSIGLFLEEAEEKDYLGILSFIALCYLLVPFQAYAAVKGFVKKDEGPWFRTPKTGKITDIFTRGSFYRWVSGILPGRRPIPATAQDNLPSNLNTYLVLATANNRFNNFQIKPKRVKWTSKMALVLLLVVSVTLYTLSYNVSLVEATPITETLYISLTDSTILTTPLSHQLTESSVASCDVADSAVKPGKAVQWTQFIPGNSNNVGDAGTLCPATASGTGWIYETPFDDVSGKLDGNFTFYYYDSDNINNAGTIRACLYAVEVSGGSLGSSTPLNTGALTGSTDMWDATTTNATETFTDPCGDGCSEFTSTQKYLYAEFFIYSDGSGNSATSKMFFGQNECGANYPSIVIDSFVIPEKLLLIILVAPFIPVLAAWLKKRKKATLPALDY